ncbi:ParB/RepB/Spo0J family partition protein [Streptomyces sp. NRRL WC-3742]|uniref:ParB/RepB/Spo0J family partition protein n=1 Tax=Streptomyces sp. NRRL WC-3742 TaxID=1463934 RepID=UPI0004CBC0FE|nr:ParB N-terminal domain-containing protein [Streptomyces sp. NRRL WC-3742]
MSAHDEFDDFFGDDNDAPVTDTRADGRLLRVPLSRLAPNEVNPRIDFGTEAELVDLGKSLRRRQIQACPAVSRGAYLKLWPDHAKEIGDVDYVLVAGERRYWGATATGNPTLNCVVDDGLAQDRRTFMEVVVSENVDRQSFNPVEEAYAVQALVAEFGSNRAVAQHFERVDGWVTQRILLTYLTPDVQDLVRKKTMPLEAARLLGKLARDNEWDSTKQLAWWQDEQKQRVAASAERSAAKKAARKAAKKVDAPAAPTGEPGSGPEQPTADPFYGRKTDRANSALTEPTPAESGPPANAEVEGMPVVPGQAGPPETTGEQQPKPFPHSDGVAAARYLIDTMPTDEFDKMPPICAYRAARCPCRGRARVPV